MRWRFWRRNTQHDETTGASSPDRREQDAFVPQPAGSQESPDHQSDRPPRRQRDSPPAEPIRLSEVLAAEYAALGLLSQQDLANGLTPFPARQASEIPEKDHIDAIEDTRRQELFTLIHRLTEQHGRAAAPPGEFTARTTPAATPIAVAPAALCLSGGGIRSATFNLGILQALACKGVLNDFHYFSTVSGGGYIGSWLTAWLKRAGQGAVLQNLEESIEGGNPKAPAAIADGGATAKSGMVLRDSPQSAAIAQRHAPATAENPAPQPIEHLRQYSHYMTPRAGLFSADTWTVITTILRNLVLNWFVFVPALLALVSAPRLYVGLVRLNLPGWASLLALLLGLACGMWAMIYIAVNRPSILLSAKPADRPADTGDAVAKHPYKARYIDPLATGAAEPSAKRATGRPAQGDGESSPEAGGGARTGGLTAIWRWLHLVPDDTNGEGRFLLWCLAPMVASVLLLVAAWSWFLNSGGSLRHVWPSLFWFFVAALAVLILTLASYWSAVQSTKTKVRRLEEAAAYLVTALIAVAIAWFAATVAERLLFPAGHDPRLVSLRAFATLSPNAAPFAYVRDGLTYVRLALIFSLALPALLMLYVLAATIFAGVSSWIAEDQDREWWARCNGWMMIVAVGWAALCLLVLLGPLALTAGGRWAQTLWPLGGGAGVATVAGGASGSTAAKSQSSGASLPSGLGAKLMHLIVPLAAPLFLAFLIALISMADSSLIASAQRLIGRDPSLVPHHDAIKNVMEGTPLVVFWSSLLVLVVLAAFGLPSSLVVHINKFSIHALYRDRLIRAYLGASRTRVQTNAFTGFSEADNLPLAGAWPPAPFNRAASSEGGGVLAAPDRLLPVLGCTLNLMGGDNLAWQERRAQSFTMSPLHCGSYWLGYRPTAQYGGGRPNLNPAAGLRAAFSRTKNGPAETAHGANESASDRGISLGTAMAISGAAANPNMGYHCSTFVTLILTFFNIRLGWWLGNPGAAGAHTYQFRGPRLSIRPFFDEAFGRTNNQNGYVDLSDGGHFENLGLYEMVLRRCKLIVVGDASDDPHAEFENMANAMRRIRVDLGIPIEPDEAAQPSPEVDRGRRHCFVYTIRYSVVDRPDMPDAGDDAYYDGVLIHLKTAICGDEALDIVQYRSVNPSFPHDTSARISFDEAQFESYRALGVHVVAQLFGRDMRDLPLGQGSGTRLCAFAAAAQASASQFEPPLMKTDELAVRLRRSAARKR